MFMTKRKFEEKAALEKQMTELMVQNSVLRATVEMLREQLKKMEEAQEQKIEDEKKLLHQQVNLLAYTGKPQAEMG